MGGWRTKLVFLLVVYFAGFATAIYCLAPVPGKEDSVSSFGYSILKSDEFAHSFNTAMHKCIDFSKTAARNAGRYIKQRYDDNIKSDG